MIVVTGGAGFIGSNLVAGLEEHGVSDIVISDVLGTEDKWRNVAKRELRDVVHPDRLFDYLNSHAKDVKVIIDLIYGLNGQTQTMLLDDIRTALACGVSGMDLYKLQIMPKSPLGQAIAKGNIKYEYNDRMLAEMFVAADALLAEQGAKALSCCHWAMREDERSGYNTLVKSGANIITCGAACGEDNCSTCWTSSVIRARVTSGSNAEFLNVAG